MRSRTFLLLVLVLVAAAALVLIILLRPEVEPVAEAPSPETVQEPAQIAEPVEEGSVDRAEEGVAIQEVVTYTPVVVALVDLPAGERIREELVTVEQRPDTNIAVFQGYTFSEPELVIGQIAKTRITRGQEILRDMLALSLSDILTSGIGSDLSLYVDDGNVAVAFPIDRLSGAALGIRPGDLVDAIMSLTVVELDAEFQTVRPNIWQRVFEPALLQGSAFLFADTSEGRLELIPLINNVAVIGPGADKTQIPRRISQLTIQQMEVIWVGSWRNPSQAMRQEYRADSVAGILPGESVGPQRPETEPDVIILSMTPQDALSLKWAQETGIDIRLVLRAQGDNTSIVTESISLPFLVQQGTITIPEPSEFGLEPRVDEVPQPSLPDAPPG